MNCTLDTQKLASMIRNQRANRTLREVSEELGDVSFSTLHRLEAGKWPDMNVFLSVCRWLNASPEQFFSPLDASTQTAHPVASQGQLIDLIQRDTSLKPVVAHVLTACVRAAYQTNQQA